MTEEEKWRAYVEANKFTGPTIKLLQLEPNLFAVLDHEYNFIVFARSNELWIYCNSAFIHPPQRERPKPQLYDYDFDQKTRTIVPASQLFPDDYELFHVREERKRAVKAMNFDIGDLDI